LIVGCNALELGRSSEECITFIARVEEWVQQRKRRNSVILTYVRNNNFTLGICKLWNAGFEILTPLVMKSTIFWNITPCSSVCQTTFRKKHITIFRLEEQAKAQSSMKQVASKSSWWFHPWFIIRTWKWMHYSAPKRWSNFHGLLQG
jgi:hypothetical protein